MKELNQHNKLNISTATLNIREAKRSVFVDSIIPKKGHTVFQLNLVTGELTPAAISEVNANLDGSVHKKVITQENCIYVSALNKDNAWKKCINYLRKN